MTRSKRELVVENEGRTNEEENLGAEEKKEKEGDQMGERKINEVDEEENEKNTKKRDSEGNERKDVGSSGLRIIKKGGLN